MRDQTRHVLLLAGVSAVFLWSMVRPYDWFTWFLEVLPAILGIGILLFVYPRFRLTNLVYGLVALHAVILIVGGHYTYARMPLFDWLRDAFELSRNHYDRLGHFAQGFVPALVTREILLRRTPLKRGGWLFVLVTSVCLAISALYELVEWGMSVQAGPATLDFVGSQGDIWDAQKDMAMCLVGAILAQLTLSRVHDAQLARIPVPAPR